MKTKTGCTGKMFWVTEAEARTFQRRIKWRGKGKLARHIYKCHYYNHWHVSSMSKAEFKKRSDELQRLLGAKKTW